MAPCYLKCRDIDGTSVIITPTDNGLGAHTRWIYHYHEEIEEDAMDVDEVEDPEAVMEAGPLTPPASTTKPMFQTPMEQYTFDAGSVIRTPVKKPQPLQRSPERIGFRGIDFWHDNSSGTRTVEETSNGLCVRYVLQRPVGSVTNMTKEQVLEHEYKRNNATFLTQVEKLLGPGERDRVAREMKEADACNEASASNQVRFVTAEPTMIIEEEEYKTLRPRKDGQPRIIKASPVKPRARRGRKSMS